MNSHLSDYKDGSLSKLNILSDISCPIKSAKFTPAALIGSSCSFYPDIQMLQKWA